MPYRNHLNGWAVVRLLPNFQRLVVARFCSPSDAEGHCQSLRQLLPDRQFIVVFDPPVEYTDAPVDATQRSELHQS